MEDIYSQTELSVPETMKIKLLDPSYLPTWEEVNGALGDLEKYYSNPETFFDKFYPPSSPVYEFLNKEFIESLGNYLVERIRRNFIFSRERRASILEIGAGNGRLTHFLSQKINEVIDGGNLIIKATDSGSWSGIARPFPVEMINVDGVTSKYQPDIIVCSWMPVGVDLTHDFRKYPSVQEYILIGPKDNCGTKWETWGIKEQFRQDAQSVDLPPFEKDGFEMIELPEIEKYQLSRGDFISQRLQGVPSCSSAFSFRRQVKNF